MFTDADLRNIIQTCEHSLDVVSLLAKYGGGSPVQNRAAVSLVQAKCEAELARREAEADAKREAAEDTAEAKAEAEAEKIEEKKTE